MTERLRLGDRRRFVRFAIVGSTGVGVDSLGLWFLTAIGGLYYLVSSVIAFECAVVSNFLLNDRWTFSDTADREPWRIRLWRFNATAVGGFAVKFILLALLTELCGLHYLLSNLVGIAAGFVWNYVLNVRWTWRAPRGTAGADVQPPT